MLSILIPTYNFDCSSLVHALLKQCESLKAQQQYEFDFEILVADDASPRKEFVACYEWMREHSYCHFYPLEKNLGRAKIRNYLASLSKYPYLVFIDCDALVCTDDFVENYWKNRDIADIVCGALRNLPACPSGGQLRYFYEKAAEKHRGVEYRNAHPYTYFTTFNVLFHRSVLESVQFDERCTEYGYEDALMGVVLEKRGYKVCHIDNPLIHNGIDPSAIYLEKIETSLRVLRRLGEPMQSASALVCLQRKLQSYHLLPLVHLIYHIFRPLIHKNLVSGHPSLSLLKFYKLGYYSTLT